MLLFQNLPFFSDRDIFYLVSTVNSSTGSEIVCEITKRELERVQEILRTNEREREGKGEERFWCFSGSTLRPKF